MKWNIDRTIERMETILKCDPITTTLHRTLRTVDELKKMGIKHEEPMMVWVLCIGPWDNRIYGYGEDIHHACLIAWKRVKKQFRIARKRHDDRRKGSVKKKVVDDG